MRAKTGLLYVLLGSSLFGCDAAENDAGTATTTSALGESFTLNGFTATWTKVGHPPMGASKIAACGPGRLFALTADSHLYSNNADGANGAWVQVDFPSAARDISCDGNEVFALNADKNLYATAFAADLSSISGWQWRGDPSSAAHISGGPGILYALNTDTNIYTNDPNGSNLRGSDSTWVWRNTAGQAARVAGASRTDPLTGVRTVRSFALNTNSTLWYNDQLLQNSSAPWTNFTTSGIIPVEIAAAAADTLYLRDSNFDLWKLKFVESTCNDGVDNDGDGRADGLDGDCFIFRGGPFAEWETGAPTGWIGGQYSLSQVQSNRDSGWRIADVSVVTPNPLTVYASFVSNSGPYAREWEFFPRMSAPDIAATASSLGYTPALIKPYIDGATTYYAVVMVRHPTVTSSLVQFNIPYATLQSLSATWRVADFEPMPSGTNLYVAALDNRAPLRSIHTHGYAEGILTWLDDNPGQRLAAWRPLPWGGYSVSAFPDSSGLRHWELPNLTFDQLSNLYGRYFSRPVDVKPHGSGSQTLYDALLVDNGFATYNQLPNGTSPPAFGGAATYDQTIQTFMKSHGIPGMGLALVQNGRLIYTKGYGVGVVQDPGFSGQESATPTTMFRVGSMSKAITAATFLKLIESRVKTPAGATLSLQTNLFRDVLLPKLGTIPGVAYNHQYDAITATEILHHIAGFDGNQNPITNTMNVAHDLGIRTTPSCKQTVEWVMGRSDLLAHLPSGSAYDYFNTDPCFISAAIEVLTGQSYLSYVQANILNPTHTNGAIVASSDSLLNRFSGEALHYGGISDFLDGSFLSTPLVLEWYTTWSNGYPVSGCATAPGLGPNGFPNWNCTQTPFPYGGIPLVNGTESGGFAASAIGYARFISGINQTRATSVLSASSWSAMTTGSSVNPSYGLFTSINPGNGDYFHNGAVGGGFGWWVYKSATGALWVLIANSSGSEGCPVTVYTGKNFTGTSSCLATGTYNTSDLVTRGIGDNNISSVKVWNGATVTLFDGDGQTGASMVRAHSDMDLSDPAATSFDKRTSSIEIDAGDWINEINQAMISDYNTTSAQWSAATWDLFPTYGMP